MKDYLGHGSNAGFSSLARDPGYGQRRVGVMPSRPYTEGAYHEKIAKYYGAAGGNAYPAPGSNGPAQTLYDNHVTYGSRVNGAPVEGSSSWPGGPNPTTARVIE